MQRGGRGPAHKEEASALKLRPDPTRWQCAEVMAAAEGFGTQEVSFLILQDLVLSSALSCRQLDGGVSPSTLTV